MRARSLIFGICTHKNKYKSKTFAFKVGRTEMRIRENQKQLYTYNCPICFNWHLTHDSKIEDIDKYKII